MHIKIFFGIETATVCEKSKSFYACYSPLLLPLCSTFKASTLTGCKWQWRTLHTSQLSSLTSKIIWGEKKSNPFSFS